eukprot:TRINITY_DN3400_c0_g2_i1.p1 TRINITY_DN3400_c0_g2~~TRINITY_DN3400_c0_g2_i1.p1  ORF type:complete len:270 (+),score=44.32 TRINITY_DN3400_c0_g2_i1:73-882(+)
MEAQNPPVQALRQVCECEFCRSGQATSHNDVSHDQSLQIQLNVAGLPALSFDNGCTKCARVMATYFAQAPHILQGKRVLEVGSGTGVVGCVAALLGANQVICTDQEPLLDILEHNVDTNLGAISETRDRVVITALQWGEPLSPAITSSLPLDVILGSDLIYAREGIAPLVTSLSQLVSASQNRSVSAQSHDSPQPAEQKQSLMGEESREGHGSSGAQVFIAVIRRFAWEESFFTLMQQHFVQETVLVEEDIAIYRFTPRPDSSSNQSSD